MPVLRARNAVPSGAKATDVASETWSIAFTSAKPVGRVGLRSSGPSSAASWAAAATEFSTGWSCPSCATAVAGSIAGSMARAATSAMAVVTAVRRPIRPIALPPETGRDQPQ